QLPPFLSPKIFVFLFTVQEVEFIQSLFDGVTDNHAQCQMADAILPISGIKTRLVIIENPVISETVHCRRRLIIKTQYIKPQPSLAQRKPRPFLMKAKQIVTVHC